MRKFIFILSITIPFCALAITYITDAYALPLPSPFSWTIPTHMTQTNEMEKQRLENQILREELAMMQQQSAVLEMQAMQQQTIDKHRKNKGKRGQY